MVWAMSRRKGFFLAEAAVACVVAAIFLGAVFSALFMSDAVFRKQEQLMRHERQKRESLIGYAVAAIPECRMVTGGHKVQDIMTRTTQICS